MGEITSIHSTVTIIMFQDPSNYIGDFAEKIVSKKSLINVFKQFKYTYENSVSDKHIIYQENVKLKQSGFC